MRADAIEQKDCRRANGTRSVSVTLQAGSQAHFRYLGEHGHWFDDGDADAIDADGSSIRA